MDKVKIMVVTHKPASLYCNDVYTPIQVGCALTGTRLGYLRDDQGDNISGKNHTFCEMTAQYWAWKNLDAEYVGLCHYRRYFKTEITADNIDGIMRGCDVVLSRHVVLDCNMLTSMSRALIPEVICLFHLFMKKEYPDIFGKFMDFHVNNNKYSPYNMFVCKKSLFDDFASWQFDILLRFEKVCPDVPFTRERRIFGYLAEHMWSFYAYINHLKVKEMDVVPMIGENGTPLTQPMSNRLRNQLVFMMYGKKPCWGDDIYVGLKNDGLIDKIEK